MKSLAMKFAAVLLAAFCLMTAIGSVFGIVLVSKWEREDTGFYQAWQEEFSAYARDLAQQQAASWATHTVSTAAQDAVEALAYPYLANYFPSSAQAGVAMHSYTVWFDGEVVSSGGADAPADVQCWSYSFQNITPFYVQIHDQRTGIPMPGGAQSHVEHYDGLAYDVYTCWDMTFRVDITLYRTGAFSVVDALEWVWRLRDAWAGVLICSGLLLAACVVYLCWAAGKKRGREEICPGGLNRLPLDLYAAVDCVLGYYGLMILFEGVPALLDGGFGRLGLLLCGADVFAMCLLVVGYGFCFAAQIKARGFWWRRSIIGWCCIRLFRGIRFCIRCANAVFRLLPVMWQWLLTAAGMLLLAAITAFFAFYINSYIRVEPGFALLFLLVCLLCAGVILYGGCCFGAILKGARTMAGGRVEYKIPTRYMVGAFRRCGEYLNSLSGAAVMAAREQMRSERMKTELITNVSHDIKTPLTSIINYVDLLQQPHSAEEQMQYLEVLSRQSQRLKKLTEDLVELSKATSGNVAVTLTQVEAGEAVMQALGEFGDKLEAVPLSVVFRQPEQPVRMLADGRLTWRVISNLLSNTVKYAQSGTRLYVDILETETAVEIAFKNISRESLNISADELMERFVRGDSARNTEGSGLGLSIAAGLMQAQGGSLALTVDGDLFKVLLTFLKA